MDHLLTSTVIARIPGLPIETIERFGFSDEAFHDDRRFESELADKRAMLREAMCDPDFADAFVSLNPELYLLARRKLGQAPSGVQRTTDVRRTERAIYNTLVRCSSRTDTTGTAGMTFIVRLESGQRENAVLHWGADRIRKRLLFLSPGYAAALSKRMDQAFFDHLATLPDRPHDRIVELSPRFRQEEDGALVDTLTGAREVEGNTDAAALARAAANGLRMSDAVSVWGGRAVAIAAELLARGVLVLRPLHAGDEVVSVAAFAGSLERAASHDPFCAAAARVLAEIDRSWEKARSAPADERAMALVTASERIHPYLPAKTSEQDDLLAFLSEVVRTSSFWPELHLRVSAAFEVRGEEVVERATGNAIGERADRILLVRNCEAGRSVRDAVLACGLADEDAAASLAALFERGVLCAEGADPATARRPWRIDRGFLARCAASLLAATARSGGVALFARRARAQESPFYLVGNRQFQAEAEEHPDSNTRLPGHGPAQRRPGFRIDRYALIEDAARDVTCTLGGALLRNLQRGVAGLYEMLAYRHFMQRREPTVVLEVGQSVPLADYFRRLQDARSQEPSDRRADDDWVAGLTLTATTDAISGAVCVERAAYPAAFQTWLDRHVIFSNPDLMLLADAAGAPRPDLFVLSETHASSGYESRSPFTTQFSYVHDEYPETDALRGFLRERGVLVLGTAANNKLLLSCRQQIRSLPVVRVDRHVPFASGGDVLRLAELRAERTTDGMRVTDGRRTYALFGDFEIRGGIVPLEESEGRLGRQLADTLGVVERADGITLYPEVRVGNVVVCRRHAFVARPHFPGPQVKGRELLRAGRRLREQLQMPRFVFARVGTKPYLVDFDSVFSLESFRDDLAKYDPDECMIAAMLPSPRDLWLRDGRGSYSCELRFAAALVGRSA